MTSIRQLLAMAALLTSLIAVPTPSRAAQSYDNCTGFIDSVPATIATQGVWCLRKDLSTAITSGNAITVATNNVTIDCNDFKLGGLAAGQATSSRGVQAINRLNLTIRHCNIRGFWVAAYIASGGGHLIEDNRVDSSTTVGLWIDGDNSVIRRNRISDTGGNPLGDITGLIAQGDNTAILDNIINGVTGSAAVAGTASGITFNGYAGLVHGNYISSILPGAGTASGMKGNVAYLTVVEQNVILNPAATAGRGIDVNAASIRPVCLNNRVRNFTITAYDTCIDGGGNFSN